MTGEIGSRTAIVGIANTRFERRPDRTGVSFLLEAFPEALADAGLQKSDVDGLIVHIGSPGGQDVDRVAELLGIDVRYCGQPWAHGMWIGSLVAEAAMAVHSGLANCVLVARGVSHSAPAGMGGVFGGAHDPEGFREGGGLTAEMAHFGMTSPGAGAALAAQRYFSRYGGSNADLAHVAVALRHNASLNPNATMRRPLTVAEHQASPWVVEPLRRLDYCQVSDGGACFLVTSLERARDLRSKPAIIAGIQGLHLGRQEFVFAIPGLGVQQQDEGTHVPREHDLAALHMAGVEIGDLDAFYTYDAFTPLVPLALERYGVAPPGEALSWLRGRIAVGEEMPVNSHGGLHSEGHSGGFGAIMEMVRQLRGTCADRQVPDAEVLMWGPTFGNAFVLSR